MTVDSSERRLVQSTVAEYDRPRSQYSAFPPEEDDRGPPVLVSVREAGASRALRANRRSSENGDDGLRRLSQDRLAAERLQLQVELESGRRRAGNGRRNCHPGERESNDGEPHGGQLRA